MTVVLNATSLADAQLVHQETGPGPNRIWLPESLARSWRMNTENRAQRQIEGTLHAAFCEGRDRCNYDEAGSLLTLDLDSADLLPLQVRPSPPPAMAAAAPSGAGAYLNYDLSAWHVGGPGAAGLIEGRAYSGWGHGALRLAGLLSAGRGRRTLAQAVWQIDEPQQRRSWQLGSIAVPDTALSPGVALHGVHLGTNAQLQPLQPQTLKPLVEGQAARSLRADVFVDGLFRQTAQVPYGPFNIEIQPQYAGRGEIDLVTTDLRGVQTRRSVPYYQAPQMLQAGASAWSFDVGREGSERRIASASAGTLAHASWRHGLNASWTAQAQVLAATRTRRVGLSADHVHPMAGLSSFSAVWQRTAARPEGRLWLGAGHELITRNWFASARAERAAGPCVRAGTLDAAAQTLARDCSRQSVAIGAALNSRWSGSAGLDRQHAADGRRSMAASLGARLQVSARSQFGIAWSRLHLAGRPFEAVTMSWSQPLGPRHTGQASLQQQGNRRLALQWSAETVPPLDAGESADRWRVYGAMGQRRSIGAGWSRRMAQADVRADAWVDERGASATGSWSGAVGLAEGRWFTTRRIDDAFVVVDVGVPDLPVLLDNREVTRTNADGWAIVTGARAHQPNNVGVDTAALPIRYAMPMDQQTVVPQTASGVLARFDVSDGGQVLKVRDTQGRPVPAGVTVRVSTQRLATAVTSRSEIFIERSDRSARIELEWAGQRCGFNYEPELEPAGGYRCNAN